MLCVFMEAWGWLSICSICQIYADHRDTTICFSYTVQVVNLYQMEAAFVNFKYFFMGTGDRLQALKHCLALRQANYKESVCQFMTMQNKSAKPLSLQNTLLSFHLLQ